MRNVMIGFFSIVILLLVSLSLTSSSGKTMRQNELDSSLSSAMMSSMESLQKRADNDAKTDLTDQQFIADAIQAALVKTDADATYKVTVYQLDAQKGLLDVGVTAKYAQVMHPSKVSARRCIVLDDYKNDLDEYFTVVFKDGDSVVKQIQLYGGDLLTAQMLPQGNGYGSATWQCNGITCSTSSMPQVFVTGDMTFTKK